MPIGVHVQLASCKHGYPSCSSFYRPQSNCRQRNDRAAHKAHKSGKSPGSKCAADYGQCGGKDWSGPSCCKHGSKCVPQEFGGGTDLYSQCIPKAAEPVSAQTAPLHIACCAVALLCNVSSGPALLKHSQCVVGNQKMSVKPQGACARGSCATIRCFDAASA